MKTRYLPGYLYIYLVIQELPFLTLAQIISGDLKYRQG